MKEDLRYPIGKFQAPAFMSIDDRRTWIQQIEDLPGMLQRAVAGLDDAQLDTTYREEGWTVRQVVHHVADSHLNGYVRFRWTLTEERPQIKTYDQPRWAELPDARSASVDLSLDLVESLHRRWTYLLKAMSDEEWQRSFDHPDGGDYPLTKALALYAWHGRHHVAHITNLREREGWYT